MRRRILLPLAFAAAAAFLLAPVPPARSQGQTGGKPSDESIETADGVKLSARFYHASASKNKSCVILMHNYQQEPNKGGWDDLAGLLAKGGFNVLRVDFRGHGGSKDVLPSKFWADPFNRAHVKGGAKNPPPSSIDFKDFRPSYFPMLVNDLAAARTLLDLKNDNRGDVNSSSIYLIGAQETAALGLLFLASEWHREAKEPPPNAFTNQRPAFVSAARPRLANSDPAGRDYGGCVWLTPSRPASFSTAAVQGLVSRHGRDASGSLREETPMLLVHGDKDKKGLDDARFYFNDVMVAKPKGSARLKDLEFTYLKGVKGTDAKGAALLGKVDQLGTEAMILEFLNKMEEQRGKKNRYERGYTKPLLVQFQSFGVGL